MFYDFFSIYCLSKHKNLITSRLSPIENICFTGFELFFKKKCIHKEKCGTVTKRKSNVKKVIIYQISS